LADGDTEAIITDNFGQIIVLGKGKDPELTITSPSPSYVSNQPVVLVTWEVSNETLPMLSYDIFVNDIPVGRAGGGQSGFIVPTSSDQLWVNYSAIDPQGDPIEYSLYVNGSIQAENITETDKTLSLNLGDGLYIITVVARDTTGDTGQSSVYVILDSTVPYVSITSPHHPMGLLLAHLR